MTIIAAPTNKFADIDSIYEEFTEAHPIIFFRNDSYEYQGVMHVENSEIHVYRCEKEVHQLHITLQGGVPVLVEGSYSIRKY